MRDRAQIFLHFLLAHADAVVGNGQRTRRLIHGQADGKIAAAQADTLVGERLIGELIHGVGGIGDQLTQKNLLVRIDRIDHQIKQTLGFRLKLFFSHACLFLLLF